MGSFPQQPCGKEGASDVCERTSHESLCQKRERQIVHTKHCTNVTMTFRSKPICVTSVLRVPQERDQESYSSAVSGAGPSSTFLCPQSEAVNLFRHVRDRSL